MKPEDRREEQILSSPEEFEFKATPFKDNVIYIFFSRKFFGFIDTKLLL